MPFRTLFTLAIVLTIPSFVTPAAQEHGGHVQGREVLDRKQVAVQPVLPRRQDGELGSFLATLGQELCGLQHVREVRVADRLEALTPAPQLPDQVRAVQIAARLACREEDGQRFGPQFLLDMQQHRGFIASGSPTWRAPAGEMPTSQL